MYVLHLKCSKNFCVITLCNESLNIAFSTPPPGGGPGVEAAKGSTQKVMVVQTGPTPVDPGGGLNPPPDNPRNPPCQVQQPVKDTVLVKFCDNVSQAQCTAIQNTINTFKNANCVSRFLFSSVGSNITSYCINSATIGNVNFNPTTGSITFSSNDAASPAFTYLLEHEYFHAYQNISYQNGVATYGKNPNTGAPNPGFVNIEFEQAVFNDVVNGGNQAFVNGTQDQKNMYLSWLSQLTNNGTAYPKLSSSNTDFINKYNGFLNEYNSLSGNPYSSQVINLTPQAFINIFNNTNPTCQ